MIFCKQQSRACFCNMPGSVFVSESISIFIYLNLTIRFEPYIIVIEVRIMTERLERLNEYFDRQIALCMQRHAEKAADDRSDEADFEKIKANIYDIFRTVLSVAVREGKDDPDAVRRFFESKTEQIPSGWAAAHEKARLHNDTARMQTERIKLDAAEDIRKAFAEIWEGAV